MTEKIPNAITIMASTPAKMGRSMKYFDNIDVQATCSARVNEKRIWRTTVWQIKVITLNRYDENSLFLRIYINLYNLLNEEGI